MVEQHEQQQYYDRGQPQSYYDNNQYMAQQQQMQMGNDN